MTSPTADPPDTSTTVDSVPTLDAEPADLNAFIADLDQPLPARPPPSPTLRARVRRCIRARCPDADVAVVDASPGGWWISFRLVQGQWITARTYAIDVSDGTDDVGEIVARALRDLADDMAKYPAV